MGKVNVMSKVVDGIGGRIAECRAILGISQGELAKKLDLSRGAPGQWESGLSEPSSAHLRALARIFGVSLEWLATGQGGRVAVRGESAAMQPEGELIALDELTGELARAIRAIVAGRKLEVYKLSTNNLAGAGYHPDDYLIVDPAQTPKARDYVLAFVNRVPIFRGYIPPYLYEYPLTDQPAPLMVDNVTVAIKGVVVSRFSK